MSYFTTFSPESSGFSGIFAYLPGSRLLGPLCATAATQNVLQSSLLTCKQASGAIFRPLKSLRELVTAIRFF